MYEPRQRAAFRIFLPRACHSNSSIIDATGHAQYHIYYDVTANRTLPVWQELLLTLPQRCGTICHFISGAQTSWRTLNLYQNHTCSHRHMAYHRYHCFHVNIVYMFMLSTLEPSTRIYGAVISAILLLLYPPYECTWEILWFSRRYTDTTASADISSFSR